MMLRITGSQVAQIADKRAGSRTSSPAKSQTVNSGGDLQAVRDDSSVVPLVRHHGDTVVDPRQGPASKALDEAFQCQSIAPGFGRRCMVRCVLCVVRHTPVAAT